MLDTPSRGEAASKQNFFFFSDRYICNDYYYIFFYLDKVKEYKISQGFFLGIFGA